MTVDERITRLRERSAACEAERHAEAERRAELVTRRKRLAALLQESLQPLAGLETPSGSVHVGTSGFASTLSIGGTAAAIYEVYEDANIVHRSTGESLSVADAVEHAVRLVENAMFPPPDEPIPF